MKIKCHRCGKRRTVIYQFIRSTRAGLKRVSLCKGCTADILCKLSLEYETFEKIREGLHENN